MSAIKSGRLILQISSLLTMSLISFSQATACPKKAGDEKISDTEWESFLTLTGKLIDPLNANHAIEKCVEAHANIITEEQLSLALTKLRSTPENKSKKIEENAELEASFIKVLIDYKEKHSAALTDKSIEKIWYIRVTEKTSNLQSLFAQKYFDIYKDKLSAKQVIYLAKLASSEETLAVRPAAKAHIVLNYANNSKDDFDLVQISSFIEAGFLDTGTQADFLRITISKVAPQLDAKRAEKLLNIIPKNHESAKLQLTQEMTKKPSKEVNAKEITQLVWKLNNLAKINELILQYVQTNAAELSSTDGAYLVQYLTGNDDRTKIADQIAKLILENKCKKEECPPKQEDKKPLELSELFLSTAQLAMTFKICR